MVIFSRTTARDALLEMCRKFSNKIEEDSKSFPITTQTYQYHTTYQASTSPSFCWPSDDAPPHHRSFLAHFSTVDTHSFQTSNFVSVWKMSFGLWQSSGQQWCFFEEKQLSPRCFSMNSLHTTMHCNWHMADSWTWMLTSNQKPL